MFNHFASVCLFVITITEVISEQNLTNIQTTKVTSEYNPFRNLDFWINKINNDSHSTWKAGKNFHTEKSPQYVEALIGTFRMPKEFSKYKLKLSTATGLQPEIKHLPETFDAREKWPQCKSLLKVRDQGECGSCWAVAATSILSDRLCITTHGRFNSQISAEELLSCCKYCGLGCDGGFVDLAWEYLIINGAVTGGEYNSSEGCIPYSKEPCEHHLNSTGPYTKCKDTLPMVTPPCPTSCTNSKYNVAFAQDHKKAASANRIFMNVSQIQNEIYEHGPVQAVYDVFEDFLHYKSGIYKRSVHDKNIFLGSHSVKIIGWGTDNSTKTPYWLIENSWNQYWGDNGTFKIVKGSNECNIEMEVYSCVPII